MKKIVIASFIALSFSFVACNRNANKQVAGNADSAGAAAAVNPEDAAVITFKQDHYDFGKITEGEKVSYDFKFTNTGKSPLIISDATATCGCTTPEYPKTPIEPGKSGDIKVTFNSEGKEGMQRKVITITSNATPSVSEVYLVGEVQTKK